MTYQAQTPNRDKFSLAMLSQDDRLARLLRARMKVFIVQWRAPSRLLRAPTVSAILQPLAWGSLLGMFSTGTAIVPISTILVVRHDASY